VAYRGRSWKIESPLRSGANNDTQWVWIRTLPGLWEIIDRFWKRAVRGPFVLCVCVCVRVIDQGRLKKKWDHW
jgi:hypothetical protein